MPKVQLQVQGLGKVVARLYKHDVSDRLYQHLASRQPTHLASVSDTILKWGMPFVSRPDRILRGS